MTIKPIPSGFNADKLVRDQLLLYSGDREIELQNEMAKWKVHFVLDDISAVCDFHAEPLTGKVNIPRRCLFRIKAHAFAYWTLYRMFTAIHTDGASPDLIGRGNAAMALLEWATRTEISTLLNDGSKFSLGEVPPDFEDQLKCCLGSDSPDIPEEIFRVAVLWILFHELTHILKQHVTQSGPRCIAEEYEADAEAIEWLLPEHLSDSDRLGRIFGIGVGLGWLAALSVHCGEDNGDTHPPELERFLRGITLLGQGGEDNREWSWAICQSVLYVHARAAGLIDKTKQLLGSFEENSCELVQLIRGAH